MLGAGESGDEWQFDRIGTEREKMLVERELQELRERLAQVEGWKKRRDDIERELAKVWVEGGGELAGPPAYEEGGDGNAGSDGSERRPEPEVAAETERAGTEEAEAEARRVTAGP